MASMLSTLPSSRKVFRSCSRTASKLARRRVAIPPHIWVRHWLHSLLNGRQGEGVEGGPVRCVLFPTPFVLFLLLLLLLLSIWSVACMRFACNAISRADSGWKSWKDSSYSPPSFTFKASASWWAGIESSKSLVGGPGASSGCRPEWHLVPWEEHPPKRKRGPKVQTP